MSEEGLEPPNTRIFHPLVGAAPDLLSVRLSCSEKPSVLGGFGGTGGSSVAQASQKYPICSKFHAGGGTRTADTRIMIRTETGVLSSLGRRGVLRVLLRCPEKSLVWGHLWGNF